jgi:hypothetical protein
LWQENKGGGLVMEDWKNTKCGTCIVQRQKPICNSCLGHQFYKPMSNADKIRNMNDEELADFLGEFEVCDVCKYLGDRGECELDSIFLCEKGFAVAIAKDWLQSEVKGSDV